MRSAGAYAVDRKRCTAELQLLAFEDCADAVGPASVMLGCVPASCCSLGASGRQTADARLGITLETSTFLSLGGHLLRLVEACLAYQL